MRVAWRICARFYQSRAKRAERKARLFHSKAEKFFRKIKGL